MRLFTEFYFSSHMTESTWAYSLVAPRWSRDTYTQTGTSTALKQYLGIEFGSSHMTFDEEIQGPFDGIHDIIQFSCLDVCIPELQYTPCQGGDGPGLGEVKLDMITCVIPTSCQILTIRTTVT